MPDSRFIPLGVITAAHGVRGAFKLKPFSDNADPQSAIHWVDRNGTSFPIRIISEANGLWLCQMAGITDRNQVEKLKGTELGLARSQLPPAQADEFYVVDLIGLTAVSPEGAVLGAIKTIQNYGAGELIEISLESTGKTELYPFTKQFFGDIDQTQKTIIFHSPEVI
jgi:16S rRNA processing protein RimM